MAPYDVNLVCWRVVHDKEFYDAILKNPAEAIRDCGLTEAERVALFDQDARVSLQASTPSAGDQVDLGAPLFEVTAHPTRHEPGGRSKDRGDRNR